LRAISGIPLARSHSVRKRIGNLRPKYFSVHTPVRYRAADGRWHSGMTESISKSGVLLRGDEPLEENTAIEYGTDKMVFFESRLPLELEDKFHLQNSDGSLAADAFVVGLHFIGCRRAVAIRFVVEVGNLIVHGEP